MYPSVAAAGANLRVAHSANKYFSQRNTTSGWNMKINVYFAEYNVENRLQSGREWWKGTHQHHFLDDDSQVLLFISINVVCCSVMWAIVSLSQVKPMKGNCIHLLNALRKVSSHDDKRERGERERAKERVPRKDGYYSLVLTILLAKNIKNRV